MSACDPGARDADVPLASLEVNTMNVSPPPSAKRGKRNLDSPVSVLPPSPNFKQVPEEQKQLLLPLVRLTLLNVYTEMVDRRLWDKSFARGFRGEPTGNYGKTWPAWERSLATRHLSAAATDGWNCVAGATQLAMEWALLPEEIPEVLTGKFELPWAIRERLAVCLSVSWKFQRANYSHFPRRFEADPPSLMGPHTHELATLAFFFMTREDQASFGGWKDENVAAIRGLYDEMVELEVDLLAKVKVFSHLTNNVQTQVEDVVADLFARGIVTADCSLAIRSIVPFFLYCSAEGRAPLPGGLVCAALVALSVANNPRAKLAHSDERLKDEFTKEERLDSWGMIHNALFPSKLASWFSSNSCYNEPSFENYDYVTPENLRAALVVIASAV